MKLFIKIFLFVFFLLIPTFYHTPGHSSEELLAKAMIKHLECYPVELLSLRQQQPLIINRDVCLASIYHKMGAVPLWVTTEGPTRKADTVLHFLKNGDEDGLEPQDYQVARLSKLWQEKSYESLAELDTLITYNLVKYIHDVSHGRMKPYMTDPMLFAEAGKRGFDPTAAIERVFASDNIEGFLSGLPPDNNHYRGLKKGLSYYRGMDNVTAWPQLSIKKLLSPGTRDDNIALIRTRLETLQDKPVPFDKQDATLYDSILEKRVLDFQGQHGLREDGIIGKNTIQALNVSPAQRIEQIRLNMARWRWQDHQLGEKYILINIANFELEGYRQGELRLSLPVIVGQFQDQTPVFSNSVKYIDINPFWNVPPEIAVEEELPALRENPNHLLAKKIRLFSSWQKSASEIDSTLVDWQLVSEIEMVRYRLRQDPGPFNALGQIKFIFPNHYSIYIHDTPAKDLFSEHSRLFSHGCIRVYAPEKLAEFMLEESEIGWSEEEIRLIMDQGERKVIKLKTPMPIHLTYQTAWLDKSGLIHFNGDVYARDEKLHKALFQK